MDILQMIIQGIITIVCAVLASSGIWAFFSSRSKDKDEKTTMLLGLGHDRIVCLCLEYIDRGWLTHDEFDNLYNYLYIPYKELGGNGTCCRLMDAVKKLPIKHIDPHAIEDKTSDNDETAQ